MEAIASHASADDWTQTLRGLKRQEAIVHLAGQPPFQIRTDDMPNLRAAFEAKGNLLQTIMAANGSHPVTQVSATTAFRRDEIDRISALGRPPAPKEPEKETKPVGKAVFAPAAIPAPVPETFVEIPVGDEPESSLTAVPASKRRIVSKSPSYHKIVKKRPAPPPVASDDSL